MKRILTITLILFTATKTTAQFTNFRLDVPQYNIIVKRTIVKKASTCASPNPALSSACDYDNSSVKLDRLIFGSTSGKIHTTGFNISSITTGDSLVLVDTIPVIDLRSPFRQVSATINYGSSGTKGGTIEKLLVSDSVVYANYAGPIKAAEDAFYRLQLQLQVIPNNDLSHSMPSHDAVRVVLRADNVVNQFYNIRWEYSLDNANWNPVPTSRDTMVFEMNGIDIFGIGYVQQLNKTVFIRARAASQQGGILYVSQPTALTHRLSSPHVVQMIPAAVRCYNDTTGFLKIYFDRALLTGERINLLLKDTVNKIDYSVFNLTALAADNSYTWPAELLSAQYQLSLLGKYQNAAGNIATYTGAYNHYAFAFVSQPPPLDFSASVIADVVCKSGNTGKATITGKGGNSGFVLGVLKPGDTVYTWHSFRNPHCFNVAGVRWCNTVKDSLRKGTYFFKVRDALGCIVKDSFSNELSRPLTFSEPEAAMYLDYMLTSPVTHPDSANGSIKLNIKGGTRLGLEIHNYAYRYNWTDSLISQPVAHTLDTAAAKFEIYSPNLTGSTYHLFATDAGYNRYEDSIGRYDYSGCKLDVFIPLPKPLPLQVSIAEKMPITCTGLTNGVLAARSSGGWQLDSLRYHHQWYVLQNGNYVPTGTNDSLLLNCAPGSYKVEITDKYYSRKMSTALILAAPPPVFVMVGTTPAKCYSSTDGSATAAAGGGTPPYRYEWSNGAQTPQLLNVPGGTYVVHVRDSFGCEAIQQVVITAPYAINTIASTTPVSCAGSCTGAIQINATGGSGALTYTWSNGQTGNSINNLCAGNYWVTIKDVNGCIKTDSATLADPAAYTVNAGPNRNICLGQTIWLDATVPNSTGLSYRWQGPGVDTPAAQARITQPGSYIVTVKNAFNCTRRDTVLVTPKNDSMHTEFIVSTQAFTQDNTILVNLSAPQIDSVQWVVPANPAITIIQTSTRYCELKFADPGEYTIGMTVYYTSGCVETVYKKVVVVVRSNFGYTGDQANAFVKRFTVYPNPNNGTFRADIWFNAITMARLRLINVLTNVMVDDRTVQGGQTYEVQYNMTGTLPSGTYVLVIETPKGNYIHKVNRL